MYLYFSDSKNIYLILEYCHDGSLYGLHQKCEHFTEQTSGMNIVKLAKALLYCYAKNIIHHDRLSRTIVDHRGQSWAVEDHRGPSLGSRV